MKRSEVEETPVDPCPSTEPGDIFEDPGEHWDQVISTIYEPFDVVQEYKRLTACLEIGDERQSTGVVMKHADRAEENWRKAQRLYAKALAEQLRYKHTSELALAPLRAAANRELTAEKRSGDRPKAITDGDTRAKMIELFHDEVSSQEATDLRMTGMVDSCKHLMECWQSRCRTLQGMLAKTRS